MRPRCAKGKGLCLALLTWATAVSHSGSAAAQGTSPSSPVQVIEVQNQVEITRRGASRPDPAHRGQSLDPGDLGRTYPRSGVLLQLSDLSRIRIRENSLFEIQAPPAAGRKPGFSLVRGLAYFLSREKPLEIQVRTRTAVAAIRGTEFAVEQDDNGRTRLTLYDGQVELSNLEGEKVDLGKGEIGVVEPGRPPRRTPLLEASNVIQWFLYYPGVLDTDELSLSPGEQSALGASLSAYRSGDLTAALTNCPAAGPTSSQDENIYRAALALAFGEAGQAAELLHVAAQVGNSRQAALAAALSKLIDSVKGTAVSSNLPAPRLREPAAQSTPLATERLAESYVLQSEGKLQEALHAARDAVGISTNFAFGWARLAEMEFSSGRIRAARTAVERALVLGPRNAQALALRGFLLAADQQVAEALACFDEAIAADGALANAWLGRGLCLIRQGKLQEGRADLETAVVLEPNRSFLRSYLGKAWQVTGREALAVAELERARQLDPRDPTPWLYMALLNRERNRINEAVDDLETSTRLNDNRRVYRSQFLLDQDQAVRSSSLATLYQGAGMRELSAAEAAHAVTYDYANYSAHQFLAESYDSLRDPTRFNLRYETAWFHEWLMATLLSPVGGTPLAQHISQHEYARFFARDRLGLVSQTEYRSDGQVRETASQFGSYRKLGYAIDLDYQHNDGVRPNNQLDRLELYGTVKYQVSPRDAVLVLAKLQDYRSGDNFQYRDPAQARPSFYYDEYQTPGALMAGYHREWAPGVHTLLLGGRLANDQRLGDLNVTNYLALRDFQNDLAYLAGVGFDLDYQNQFEVYGGELNQIIQAGPHTLIVGGRYQAGTFTTSDLLQLAAGSRGLAAFFPSPPALDTLDTNFERASGYAYWTWEALPRLWLTPGLAYDHLRYPENYRHPPVSAGEAGQEQFGPKASVVWSPLPEMTWRGAYTRSLGGVSYDESYRLEPVQLAGFSQAFRNLMPESLVGSVSAPTFETAGLGLDLKFKTRTYVTIQAELLESDAHRSLGVFESSLLPLAAKPGSLSENLDYRERGAAMTVNQLLDRDWAIGARYSFTRAELERTLPGVPLSVYGGARREDEGDLHQFGGFLLYNHPTGWFAQADLNWYLQDSSATTYPNGVAAGTALPGEEFPQLNLLAGFRFRKQRGELAMGVMNLTGEDYRLNPVNLYCEFPRERVFYTRLRLRF